VFCQGKANSTQTTSRCIPFTYFLKELLMRLTVRFAVPVVSLLLLSTLAVAQTAFINEFHYDNAGTDSNEKIEIIAPAGTNLSGWKVLAYDGTGRASYATYNLTGTTSNQCGGYGTNVVTATGLQNGAPDGLALINASGAVVQFLSYEGSFTASGGAASGRVSVDVGKAETADTPVGQSIQLSGSGTQYSNFIWNAPRTASFGSCNTGQTFTGGTTDAAPSVSSLNPAAGSLTVAVSSNITVTFSEAVSTTSSWFSLSCSSSGNKVAVVSGTGATRTINPNVDFSPLETCTFSITAANVADLDGTINTMASNYSATLKMAGASGGYYSSANTSSAANLRSSLHNIIDDHSKVSYSGIWAVIAKTEQDPLNANRVLEIYKNASYAKETAGNNFYNREHSWPKSLGFPDDGATNFAYTDGHHLFASDITYNSARGNKYFGNCTSSCTEYATQTNFSQGGGSGSFPGNSNWTNTSLWQTWIKRKGDVARAMFYMDVRYEGGTNGNTGSTEPDLRLTNNAGLIAQSTGNATVAYMGLLDVLLQWHIDDPVDDREVLRNQAVFDAQGNRNPFIDRPEWVKCIYNSVCN
jgi:endonuclease I